MSKMTLSQISSLLGCQILMDMPFSNKSSGSHFLLLKMFISRGKIFFYVYTYFTVISCFIDPFLYRVLCPFSWEFFVDNLMFWYFFWKSELLITNVTQHRLAKQKDSIKFSLAYYFLNHKSIVL